MNAYRKIKLFFNQLVIQLFPPFDVNTCSFNSITLLPSVGLYKTSRALQLIGYCVKVVQECFVFDCFIKL